MTPAEHEGNTARRAGAGWLADALAQSRRDTLAIVDAVAAVRPALDVPYRENLNPPLWELGHIGWFQEFWIARNPQRERGAGADPDGPRRPGVRADADALYHSSFVPHAARWGLPLPDAAGTRADLERQLEGTLALLREAGDGDDALYFFRLALFHEDMHHEAALYMAQGLGIPIDDPRWQGAALPDANPVLDLPAGAWTLGHAGAGFAFDNERAAHTVDLPATHVDSRVVRWAEYLPFVEAGGYADPRWWSEAGQTWLKKSAVAAPLYLRRDGAGWRQWRHGRWTALDPRQPACHLSAFEAQAWCRWAGCRLPTEAEWERAALTRPEAFDWGRVWEWTADAFEPYPGFEPHPYRDYSAPWFGTRIALRGASFMTQARLRHPRYRNFFMPHRSDVPAGFRACRA